MTGTLGDASRYPEHLGPADAVMWDIEKDPRLRSTITAVALLDAAPDWDRLRSTVEVASRVVPRLRQRVVVPPMRLGPPRWVTDDDFDLSYHLRRLRVAEPGDMRALLDLAQPISATGFDRARPLWELTLVEGLADGRAALVQKLHHSLTDGLGAVELAGALLSDRPDADPVAGHVDGVRTDVEGLPAPPVAGAAGAVASGVDAVAWWLRHAVDAARAAPLTLWRSSLGAASDPLGTARDAAALARSATRVVAPLPPSQSPLLGHRSLRRRFHVLEYPLDALQRAGRAAEGTLNDALLAGVVGGVASYHRHHRSPLDVISLTMPISRRDDQDPLGGNRFVPARFTVPADVVDPVERMRRLGDVARRWRDEPGLGLTDDVAFVLDRLPLSLTTAFMASLLTHVDAVVTNVPGLPTSAYLAGSEVLGEYAFAPPAGAALNVALVSHCGTACIGVVVDLAAVPDDDLIVECIRASIDDVVSTGDGP